MENENQQNGVALIVARHDEARSQDISAYGAAYAYLTGKFLCNEAGIWYPEHIFYSPVARTRNTAKMHQLAMKINDIYVPTMSYDARFHEHASDEKIFEAVDDAVLYAKSQDLKTVEIVGHEPTVSKIMKKFRVPNREIDYGGCVIFRADSWDDLRQGKVKTQYIRGSKDLADLVLGKEQADLLDELMAHGQTGGKIEIGDIGEKAKQQFKKAYKWIDAKEAGKETAEKYSPVEFLEILDAYKFWGAQSMTAVGIAPDEKNPFYSKMQQLLFGQDTYFNQKFLAEFHRRDADRMDDGESRAVYPVFNAVAKMVAQRAGVAEKVNQEYEKEAGQMEDFALYRDILSAGEERCVEHGQEKSDMAKFSYRVTQKEQQEHDRILDVVQKLKANQR